MTLLNLPKLAKGVKPGINRNEVYALEVFVPPLPEQKRIVAVLDKCFTAINKAKENAKVCLSLSKALFESYLQEVFGSTGSPNEEEALTKAQRHGGKNYKPRTTRTNTNGWKMKRIIDVASVINGYAFSSNDFKSNNSVKSIKITNVGVKEFVEENDNYLPEKYRNSLKEVQVKTGDIVIALTRTIISAGLKVAVVPKNYNGALVNQRVAALVANNKINQSYLYYYLSTSVVADYVLKHVNTLMQPNLSINDLKNMPIPLPTLKEQQAIVRQLDALRADTQKLEKVYQKKIADLEELKKSILQKAFAGELSIP